MKYRSKMTQPRRRFHSVVPMARQSSKLFRALSFQKRDLDVELNVVFSFQDRYLNCSGFNLVVIVLFLVICKKNCLKSDAELFFTRFQVRLLYSHKRTTTLLDMTVFLAYMSLA